MEILNNLVIDTKVLTDKLRKDNIPIDYGVYFTNTHLIKTNQIEYKEGLKNITDVLNNILKTYSNTTPKKVIGKVPRFLAKIVSLFGLTNLLKIIKNEK